MIQDSASRPDPLYINTCKRKLTFHLSKSRIRYHRNQWNEGQQAKVRREHPRLVKRLLENSVKYRNLTITVKRCLFGKAIGVLKNHQFICNIKCSLFVNFFSIVSVVSGGQANERSSIEPELLLCLINASVVLHIYLVNNLWKLIDAYHSHKPPAAGWKSCA